LCFFTLNFVRFEYWNNIKTNAIRYISLILIITSVLIVSFFVIINKPDIDSINGRLLIWKISSNILHNNLMSGIGANNFKNIYNREQGNFFSNNIVDINQSQLANDTFYSFNEYLQLAVELGLLGIVIIIIIFLLVIIK